MGNKEQFKKKVYAILVAKLAQPLLFPLGLVNCKHHQVHTQRIGID